MATESLLGSKFAESPSDSSQHLAKEFSPTAAWDLPVPPLDGSRDGSQVPFIVEDPPDQSSHSSAGYSSSAMVSVSRPTSLALPDGRATPSSGRSTSNGPMSVALDGPNPSPHFVSLENIARLYIELKNDRDYLVQESSRIFSDRINVVHELRDIESQLNELIQQKAQLEESLDTLGLRDEENRMQMAIIDDKVANIACESQRFEATVRGLKGQHGPGIPPGMPGSDAMRTASMPQAPRQLLGVRPKPSAACKRSMYGHTGNVLGLDVCLSKNVLISASSDRSLRTWDTTTGRRLDTLYGHDGWVHAVAFATSSGLTGQRAVSGSGDKTVKVWDLADARGRGSCKSTIRGHEAGVTCVQLDGDNILVSGSLDKTLRRYDLNDSGSGNCTVIHGHEQGVYCLQFVRHGLASGGGDSLIRMHDMRTGLCHRTLAGHMAGAVRALQFDDVQLVSGGADCMLRFWDLRTGGCTGVVETGARINAIHVEDRRVIVACSDHLLKIYDLASKDLVAEHAGHLGPVLSLSGGDSAETFFTGSADQTAKQWSLPEAKATTE